MTYPRVANLSCSLLCPSPSPQSSSMACASSFVRRGGDEIKEKRDARYGSNTMQPSPWKRVAEKDRLKALED